MSVDRKKNDIDTRGRTEQSGAADCQPTCKLSGAVATPGFSFLEI